MKEGLVCLLLLFFSGCSVQKQKETDAFLAMDAGDRAIFDTVQRATFRYFWEGAEPSPAEVEGLV